MSTAAGTTHSVALDPEAQRVIEEQRARRLYRLASRDRRRFSSQSALFLSCQLARGALPSERDPVHVHRRAAARRVRLAFRLDFEISSARRPDPADPRSLCSSFSRSGWSRSQSPRASCVGSSARVTHAGRFTSQRVFLQALRTPGTRRPAIVLGSPVSLLRAWSDWPIYVAALARSVRARLRESTGDSAVGRARSSAQESTSTRWLPSD